MDLQDRFEAIYADRNDLEIAWVKDQRNDHESYYLPSISKAWRYFKEGAEVGPWMGIDLGPQENKEAVEEEQIRSMINIAAVGIQGVTPASARASATALWKAGYRKVVKS